MNLENTRTHKSGILIADGNFLFRTGLRSLICREPDFQVAGEAGCQVDLLAALEKNPVEILVISSDLLGSDGQFAALLRGICPGMLIVNLLPTSSIDVAASVKKSDPTLADLSMHRSDAPALFLKGLRRLLLPEPSPETQTSDLRALSISSQVGKPDVLTHREKEVVRLLSEGMTVRQAAGELGLSCKTVEAHTLNLMRKLDIHDRSSLIEYAVTAGMV